MSTENNGLRFDIYERVNLPDNVAAIEELEEIELVPRIQVIDQGEVVLLQGQLVLNGIYRGEGFGQDQIALEHWIPVEISLPMNRVRQLDEITIDIDTFHVEPVSERALNITGVLALRGIYLEEQEQQHWEQEAEYEQLSFVAQSNTASEEQAPSWRSEEDIEQENRENWFTASEEEQEQSDKLTHEWIQFSNPQQIEVNHEQDARFEHVEVAEDEQTEQWEVEDEQDNQDNQEAVSYVSHFEERNAVQSEEQNEWQNEERNEAQFEEQQALQSEEQNEVQFEEQREVQEIQFETQYEEQAVQFYEQREPERIEQAYYAEADYSASIENEVEQSSWQSNEAQHTPAKASFGIKDLLSSSLREQAVNELQRLDAERERIEQQLLKEKNQAQPIEWRQILLQPDGREQFRKIKMYIVQKNDTLDMIAGKYDINPRDLLQHNKLHETAINEGQLLYIP